MGATKVSAEQSILRATRLGLHRSEPTWGSSYTVQHPSTAQLEQRHEASVLYRSEYMRGFVLRYSRSLLKAHLLFDLNGKPRFSQ